MAGMRYIAILLLVIVVHAEKAPMSPAALTKVATQIVVGNVVAIYTRETKEGRWKYTRYCAEVRVTAVEKGTDAKVGDLVYARYWQRRWASLGVPPPSTNGHRGLPAEGDRLRIYLARNAYDGFTKDNNDGGFNVIGANGFERFKKPTK